MKHIIIGDLHGRDVWKRAPLDGDSMIVFLGDYVDSKYRSDHEILSNLKEIIAFKKSNPERVVLLIGNHDAHYIHYPYFPCPGFRPSAQFELTSLFSDHRHRFQLAYQVDNILFSHAGLTNTWLRRAKGDPIFNRYSYPNLTLAETLNMVEWKSRAAILYAPCHYRTGENSDGGPVWADAQATIKDGLDGYHQVVGHTPMDEPSAYVWETGSVTYLDVLHKMIYFHEMDI